MSPRSNAILVVLVLFGIAGFAQACSIPVFRYALERWELTRYEVLVFAKEPLAAEADAWLKKLESGQPAANLTVRRLDVANLPKAYEKLWANNSRPLPCILLRSGDPETPPLALWSGPVDEAKFQTALDSPMRRTLVDRLKRGDTGAFLILGSDDSALDVQTLKLLEKELARLEKVIELPEQSDEGPQLKTGLPLKVAFSIHKLRRDDPDELAFVQQILGTEEDLDKVKGPIVLPVFGRGRLLCSLYGKDLDAIQIGNVVRYMCGECSCQVKELNPGVDLLIAADWADLLDKAGPPTVRRPDTPPAFRNKKK